MKYDILLKRFIILDRRTGEDFLITGEIYNVNKPFGGVRNISKDSETLLVSELFKLGLIRNGTSEKDIKEYSMDHYYREGEKLYVFGGIGGNG